LVLPTAASGQNGQDLESAYVEQRSEMVKLVEVQTLLAGRHTGISQIDGSILQVLREVPRHAFVPPELRALAYEDRPLPIGHGQNIASPLLIAMMTQLARLRPEDVVFETGTGAGYHAAVLSRLAAEVYSVEVIERLAKEAKRALSEMGYDNVHVSAGDGYFGWPEHGPYDVILIKEAIDHVPPPLIKQLKPEGRMVIPLGPARGPQFLTLVEKRANGRLIHTPVMPVVFSPLQGGERT